MFVITAYGVQCLIAGCQGSGADSRLFIREEGCCTTSRATSLFLDKILGLVAQSTIQII